MKCQKQLRFSIIISADVCQYLNSKFEVFQVTVKHAVANKDAK